MTSDDQRQRSRATWDEMAPGWERNRDYMWRTTRHVAEWLVDRVGAQDGDTILELAGGPGDIGFLAAERVGPSGKIVETDFAPQMVDVARRRAAELGLTNVETRVLDAERMDLADDSVDGILCRWGFMLMLDPDAALAECRRVLKSGGNLALSVWGAPEKNPWVTVTGMTMIQLGHQPGGDPFRPGGMFSMADPDKVRSMLTGAGFQVVEVEEVPVEWASSSFDESWGFMTEVAGAIASLVKELPSGEVAEFRAALEKNLEPYRTDSGIVTPGVTVNVLAR
ncbi:MAG TPA: methyltransferase domain-containing protein [Actinomycetota bacterium]|nr:methyltransferase domain-containing protein [Actinomycetota bacterium]